MESTTEQITTEKNAPMYKVLGEYMGWELSKNGFWTRSDNGYPTSFMEYPPRPAWSRCDNTYWIPDKKYEQFFMVLEKWFKADEDERSWSIVGALNMVGRLSKMRTNTLQECCKALHQLISLER